MVITATSCDVEYRSLQSSMCPVPIVYSGQGNSQTYLLGQSLQWARGRDCLVCKFKSKSTEVRETAFTAALSSQRASIRAIRVPRLQSVRLFSLSFSRLCDASRIATGLSCPQDHFLQAQKTIPGGQELLQQISSKTLRGTLA